MNKNKKESKLVSLMGIGLVIATLVFLLLPSVCTAGVLWTANGVEIRGTGLSSSADGPQLTTDGSGGAIIAWQEDFYHFGVYAKRVDSTGLLQWADQYGVEIRNTGMSGNAYEPKIITNGSGGAIIAWLDTRDSDVNVYAQRVDSSGAIQWTKDGVALREASNDALNLEITTDDMGGAIVVYKDNRTSDQYAIYAQRVHSSGAALWNEDGVKLRGTSVSSDAKNPSITKDGSGGAIVSWSDCRDGKWDIYAQKVNYLGGVQWTADGVELRGTGLTGNAGLSEIVPDGSGGAIVAWQDSRGSAQDYIFAQRIDSSGTVLWTTNGVELRGTGLTGDAIKVGVTSDGSGGAIVAWQDSRSGSQSDIYAQRIDSSGTVQWTTNGVELRGTGLTGDATDVEITSDGSGGAIASWKDFRSGSWTDIYTQRIDSSGAVQWATNGVELTGLTGHCQDAQITADGSGGAIVTWEDYRSGSKFDIFAQRISNDAPTVTGITPEIGNRGSTVSVTDLAGTNFYETPIVKLKKSGETDIDATGVTVESPTQITCSFDLPSDAALGDWDVYVENPDGQSGTLAECFSVIRQEPTVTGITPDIGNRGTTVSVTDLSGTNFYGTPTVELQMSGETSIPGTGLTVESPTQITCSFDLPSDAALGDWDVYVENPDSQNDTLTDGFTVIRQEPTVTGITPDSTERGGTVDITDLSGTNFYGTPIVKLKKSGESDIDASDVTAESPTQITCSFDLPLDTALGLWDVYVENPDGQNDNLIDGFTVNAPTPTVTGITPDNAVRGTTVDITDLEGTNFYGTPTVELQMSGETDIDASTVTVESPTQITCTFDLPSDTTPGDWDVYVENPDGKNDTLSNGLTIIRQAPTVTDITPDSAERGGTVNITDLSGTYFYGTSTVKLKKSGETDIDADDVTVTSPTQITCSFDLPLDTALGDWDVYVENLDGQNDTLADGFTVDAPAPTITGITPDNAERGGTVDITDLSGTFFYGTPTVKLKKSGETDIDADDVTVTSPIHVTCSFDLPLGTALGDWDVYVENPDGQNDALLNGFTVNAPEPTITGITPDGGNRGSTINISNLAGTNFYGTPTVKLKKTGEADINASAVTVKSPTKITCSLDLPSDAALGDWDVYVENPDGKNDTLADGFAVVRQAPTVTGITPDGCNRGATVDITNLSGTFFYGTPVVKLKKNGEKDISASDVTVKSPTKITCSFDLSQDCALGDWDVYVENPDGQNDTLENGFKVANQVWYLAEGTTAWGFETYITIENPNDEEVKAGITYNTEDGPVSGGTHSLPPMSQTTINPQDTLGQKDFSTEVESLDGRQIAVDRTMIWTGEGAASPEGHCSIGVNTLEKTWYLPEGSSAWGFETWLLIQNPNNQAATAQVTYMLDGEGPITVAKEIPPNSRRSYSMADDIGQRDASIKVESDIPVIPERAMYRNNKREGHESIGTASPSNDYYLAEGAVGYESGFTTYVLVQNPSNEKVHVFTSFLTGAGEVEGPAFSMEPNSRRTIKLNDYLPPNTDVSTHVYGDKPIIAERAMYWNTPTGEVCHDSIGMAGAHKTFYLPDGQTSEGRETWTLVSNPNNSDVKVKVSYLAPSGEGNVVFEETIPANSRKSFNMKDRGINGRAAVLVESLTKDRNVMVERSMYWNNRGAGTDTIGGYSD